MQNLIRRITVLALCFTLIMSCVVEATPQDLQNMSGRDITAAFKAQKLKVKKAKYSKNLTSTKDSFFNSEIKECIEFRTSNSTKNNVTLLIYEDSNESINEFASMMGYCWKYGSKYEYYRCGNVIIEMSRKINRKTRTKYKKALKSIYNRPAQVADQK